MSKGEEMTFPKQQGKIGDSESSLEADHDGEADNIIVVLFPSSA